jgi:hypothetical protein
MYCTADREEHLKVHSGQPEIRKWNRQQDKKRHIILIVSDFY